MKKTVLFAVLIASISLFSCDKTQQGSEIDAEGLVAVTLDSDRSDASNDITKTLVNSRGATNWNTGDFVKIVDVDNVGRTFSYISEGVQTTGKFTGRLLAGKGSQKYYAYYAPLGTTHCNHGSNYCLTFSRFGDLEIEENGIDNEAFFGEHCPMVAIPITFDAENVSQGKRFQFYHVNCLIEANVTTAAVPADVVFDRVKFTVNALDNVTPFNTCVGIDMKQIVGGQNVQIPYTEPETKIGSMYTDITLKTPKTIGQLTSSKSGYGIPIFALPTSTGFRFEAIVEFFKDDVLVCKLRKTGSAMGQDDPEYVAPGLKLAGLNVLNYTASNRVEL